MYDIRCRDIMKPHSVARLSGGSVTKSVLRPKRENNPNRLAPNSIIKKYHLHKHGTVIVMRDFQTWLITQVTAARGAACQFLSELPVCPGCSVYNSQAAELIIQAT